jgi:hypothetical protein
LAILLNGRYPTDRGNWSSEYEREIELRSDRLAMLLLLALAMLLLLALAMLLLLALAMLLLLALAMLLLLAWPVRRIFCPFSASLLLVVVVVDCWWTLQEMAG